MQERTKKQIFHVTMFISIIAVIIFAVGMVMLRYHVEGEEDMPFDISDIKIISSAEGIDREDAQNKWNMVVNQNNDIYLYIVKNEDYTETEVIDNIVLDNFNIVREKEIGKEKIYMPSANASYIFENKEEYNTQSIKFEGDLEQNIKNLRISNQGGIIVFRYSNDNVGEYISNEEEIKHNELFKKLNLYESDFNAKVSFDITINLSSHRSYRASVKLDLKPQSFLENGSSHQEIDNFYDIVFKRVEK